MTTQTDLLASIQSAHDGLTLGQLLELHADLTRRTAQRWLTKLIDQRRWKRR